MPGSRHGCIIEWLGNLANQTLDSSVRYKLSVIRGHDWMEFQGEWKESRTEPDLGISWIEDVGGTELHTVVEVAISQSRQSLFNIRDLYLKGTSQVSRFVFVNIITDPEYTSPEELDIDELRIIQKADFQLDSDQGPLWYKCIQWVGKTTLVWEVWERNLENGEPKQAFSATIDPNDSKTRLPFFEIPTTIATGNEAVTVAPSDIHELWYHRWKHAIIDEAMLRMRKYVRDVNQRRNYAADLAEQKDEAVKMRQEANEERTERWRRRPEC